MLSSRLSRAISTSKVRVKQENELRKTNRQDLRPTIPRRTSMLSLDKRLGRKDHHASLGS
jgi:hypothetical protein